MNDWPPEDKAEGVSPGVVVLFFVVLFGLVGLGTLIAPSTRVIIFIFVVLVSLIALGMLIAGRAARRIH